MLLVVTAILVIVICCVLSYLLSRPMLTKYLKSYVLTIIDKVKEGKEETKEEEPKSKRKFQLSLWQALSLDDEDEVHVESIENKFTKVYQISDAVRHAGLEQSNVIIGIDFSASNEWQGRQSFDGKSLHDTSKKQKNPYQKVMSIIPDILAPFDDDNLIPCFGFGDSATKDKSVFPFKPDGSPCHGFHEVLKHYNKVKKSIELSGPTSLVPIINKAVEITVASGGFHILLVIMDGQIEEDQDDSTQFAIVEASHFPLAIIMVGVGDGPFDRMHLYDDKLPARQFDNFHFVNYHQCVNKAKTSRVTTQEMYFALHALMEIPDQYKKIKSLGMLSGPAGGVAGVEVDAEIKQAHKLTQ